MRKHTGLFLVLIILLLVPACSTGTDQTGPGGAVQRFYGHLNDGDYAAAKDLYNTRAREALDDPEFSSEEGFRMWAEDHTKQGSIAEIRILSEETAENECHVKFEIVFDDGTTQAGQVTATLEGEEWKLDLIG
jgi:hypothetical protein